MFGIESFGIWSVYLLCILSAIACAVYGIYNWNKGAEEEAKQIEEELEWQKVEDKV